MQLSLFYHGFIKRSPLGGIKSADLGAIYYEYRFSLL